MNARMMRLTFIVSLLLVVAACKKSNPVTPLSSVIFPAPAMDSTINGDTLNYPKKQNFSLKLNLAADAGNQWIITMTDTTVVCLDSTAYWTKPNQIGGLISESFYFCTMNPGRSVITMIERQPWQGGGPTIDSLAFTVIVSH